jgi:hypothetical protein
MKTVGQHNSNPGIQPSRPSKSINRSPLICPYPKQDLRTTQTQPQQPKTKIKTKTKTKTQESPSQPNSRTGNPINCQRKGKTSTSTSTPTNVSQQAAGHRSYLSISVVRSATYTVRLLTALPTFQPELLNNKEKTTQLSLLPDSHIYYPPTSPTSFAPLT